MTLNGAIKQLHELRSAEDMPIYYRPVIAEVINVLLMDTQEVKHGQWIEWDNYDGTYKCSVCGVDWDIIEGTPQDNGMYYCPNCGADMRGE